MDLLQAKKGACQELAFLLGNRAEMVDSAVKIRLGLFFLLGFWASLAEAQVDSLFIQEGTASYYGRKFHGKRTFSGEFFSMDSLTAAHKRLPMGTLVRVINQKNDLAVVVRINDRLPSYSKRQIDISRAAATRIEMIQDGLAKVRIEAAHLDQLDKLVEYYADREHPGLRVRPYYQGIVLPKRTLDLNLSEFQTKVLKNFPPDFQLLEK